MPKVGDFAGKVALIGRSLNLSLPSAYIDTLVRYPFPRDSDLARVILYADPRKVVDRNNYYRKRGFFGHSWPKHFLVIGDFENGDLIVLDTTRKEPNVLIANHELSSGALDVALEDTGMLLTDWTGAVLSAWKDKQK